MNSSTDVLIKPYARYGQLAFRIDISKTGFSSIRLQPILWYDVGLWPMSE